MSLERHVHLSMLMEQKLTIEPHEPHVGICWVTWAVGVDLSLVKSLGSGDDK